MKRIKCEDCLKLVPEQEIEELILTKEKICKSCYEIRKKLNHLPDPSPWP